MRLGSAQFSAPRRWRSAAVVVAVIVVAALALPVLAADPSADPSASSSATPGDSVAVSVSPGAPASVTPIATPPRPATSASPEAADDDNNGKPDKGDKGNKAPEVAITLHGTITMATDPKGRPAFSLSSGGTTYRLEAGPPWFWGANNPLAKFAGKTVTISGETRTGSTEVDVLAVDGAAIREPGRPPWAGGWKAVGDKHPGWSQAKADRFKAKFGDCFPPGLCKQAEEAPTGGLGGD